MKKHWMKTRPFGAANNELALDWRNYLAERLYYFMQARIKDYFRIIEFNFRDGIWKIFQEFPKFANNHVPEVPDLNSVSHLFVWKHPNNTVDSYFRELGFDTLIEQLLIISICSYFTPNFAAAKNLYHRSFAAIGYGDWITGIPNSAPISTDGMEVCVGQFLFRSLLTPSLWDCDGYPPIRIWWVPFGFRGFSRNYVAEFEGKLCYSHDVNGIGRQHDFYHSIGLWLCWMPTATILFLNGRISLDNGNDSWLYPTRPKWQLTSKAWLIEEIGKTLCLLPLPMPMCTFSNIRI